MFQTRMQQSPPHSPGVTELIQDTRSQLNVVFQNKFSVELFNNIEPNRKELCKLSVGPISNQYNEVLDLAKILYGWVIETMQINSLRNVLSVLGGTVDNAQRQIKLLEKILVAKGLDEAQSRSMTAPLVGLNNLRIGSAHIGSLKLESSLHLMGASTIPQKPRAIWNLCVDAVTECLIAIANAL